MKKIALIVGFAGMLFLSGCGGEGDSSTSVQPKVDNSNYLENQYGYFGDGVILGHSLVVGDWTNTAIYDGKQELVNISFRSDGSMIFTNTGNGLSFNGDYGVTRDGTVMKNSLGDTVAIQASSGNNCYDVLLTNINQKGSLSAKLCKE